jgi:hypothetical protein
MMDQDIIPYINELESRYRDGDAEALHEALNLCTCLEDSPMPGWVADGLNHALCKYNEFEVKTLDDAFGVSRKKGMHLDKERAKAGLKNRIAAEVFRAHRGEKKVSTTDDLFAEIGAKMNMTGSKVKRLYYE